MPTNVFAYNKAWLAAGVFGGLVNWASNFVGDFIYQGFPALGAFLATTGGITEARFESWVSVGLTAVIVYFIPNKGT